MAPNKLGSERSPYLLQHASNPVNWYPWGEEAFQAAKESNKLIFLSVGYSTCHWCHVMERESFESSEVMKINKVVLRNLFYDLPFLGTCSYIRTLSRWYDIRIYAVVRMYVLCILIKSSKHMSKPFISLLSNFHLLTYICHGIIVIMLFHTSSYFLSLI